MKGWGKIAISCRCGYAADPAFLRSWTKLILNGRRRGDLVLGPMTEMPQHYAASALATSFLKTDADTLLYIDDDMTFEQDDLTKLRDDKRGWWKYDIMSALALSGKHPHYPVILQENGKKGWIIKARPEVNKVVEVGMVGLAFTLIRRRAFEKVEKIKKATDLFFQWGPAGDGEDAGFCIMARKAGCRIGVNTSIPIGHRVKVNVKWDLKETGVNYEEEKRVWPGKGKAKRICDPSSDS